MILATLPGGGVPLVIANQGYAAGGLHSYECGFRPGTIRAIVHHDRRESAEVLVNLALDALAALGEHCAKGEWNVSILPYGDPERTPFKVGVCRR